MHGAVAVLLGESLDGPAAELRRHRIDGGLVGQHLARPGLALFDVARHHDDELVGLQVLLRDALDVGQRHLAVPRLIGLVVVARPPLEFQRREVADVARDIGEHRRERAQPGRLRELQVLLGDVARPHPLDLVHHQLRGEHDRFVLRLAERLEGPRIVDLRRHRRVGRVGEAVVGPHDLRDPRRERPAAQRVVHQVDRRVVRVVPGQPDVADLDDALVGRGALRLHHVDAGLRGLLALRPRRRGLLGVAPLAERRLELLQHLGLLEVAGHDQNGVVRAPVLLVPRDQVVARDAVDGRLGRLRHDRRVVPVDEALERPAGHLADVPVAVPDPGQHRLLLALEAVLRERRVVQQVHPDLQPLVHVTDVQRQRRRRHGARQEVHPLVDLVGGHRRRAARAHDGAGQGVHAELVERLEEGAPAAGPAARRAAPVMPARPPRPIPPPPPPEITGDRMVASNHGNLVIFGDVDDKSVRQDVRNSAAFGGLKSSGGILELIGTRSLGRRPGLRGRLGRCGLCQQRLGRDEAPQCADQHDRRKSLQHGHGHFLGAGSYRSRCITPVTLLSRFRYFFATRIMSAAVTAIRWLYSSSMCCHR